MPIYFNRQGQQVSAHEALIGGKVIRDGYRQTLAPGEYASFDLSLMDNQPRHTVYLADNSDPNAWGRRVRDYVRDNAAFAPERACLSGDAPPRASGPNASADGNRLVRDLARAAQY